LRRSCAGIMPIEVFEDFESAQTWVQDHLNRLQS